MADNRPESSARLTLIGLFATWLIACGPSDPNVEAAAREYAKAISGNDAGMPLEQQIEHVSRAIQLDPDRASYWQLRADYRTSLRKLSAAQSDLDRAIALQDRPCLRFTRGRVVCERGAYVESLADFDLAIAAQPHNTQFYGGRSIARSAVGRASEGLTDAEQMIAQAPNNADGYYARGVARMVLGQTRDAIDDFTRVILERPELAHPLRARALAYGRLGDDERCAIDRAEAEKAGRWGWQPCLEPWLLPDPPPTLSPRTRAGAGRVCSGR
jgi:tetratricopeptide (TPR) repeat protein